ncbi:MAG: NAD(P)H-hydrate dehydratase [Alphaproteobacteria bacterium]|nr:NAD(P)H-hydrate dehydratase [Alphaproteobacteria bacterium]MBU1513559.1 NAD(P)H-hydrate dehydratase [Alphaproteobacteria bacterium]MBU2094796.1 NAD(P)H-hydrate dehydratase [Alphaproteobacteria bacterium]MBU2150135.1 NAD(P)H-hydrate dehydratase [Alphaproteobacteria bacterium]MBU2309336.1 NAD(P)H-hydrate dehydratase [Alphaproteobacteria bacterium]
MAAADRAAIAAGTSGVELMERAGQAVVDAVVQRFHPQPVLVLCGPGNNGGDGYVIARLLKARGWPVEVRALGDPATPDAQAMAARWDGVTRPLNGTVGEALVIDALFGAGLSRPLDGVAANVAGLLASRPGRVVAVDVPSGVPGDTGEPLGPAVCAGLTVTFHARKLGHVLEPGRGLCGEVVVADIGLGETPSKIVENGPDLWLPRFPWPSAQSHKHARGRLIVVSGEAWSTGAARLSARAGLRIGAGLVTLYAGQDALAVNAAHLEAVMLKPFDTDLELEQAADQADAAVIGPAAGVSETTLLNVLALARTGAALVLDADAITVFRDDPEELFSVLDRDDVLTPHPGEFERLFPGMMKAAPQRVAAARAAAEKAGAVVLLKGADTVIAAPDGRTAVNINGSPWLATAGSGDVLAGYIGGLVSQGMESFEAACAGAWIHAEAAELHGPGLISEDLPGLTPAVLRRLYDER